MRHTEHKFEKYIQPQFPIYASVQSGREILVKNHHHSSAEIMLVLEGHIKALIGTAYYECKKGDILFIPPSTIHEVLSLTDDAAIQGIVYEFSLVYVEGLQLDFSELFLHNQRAPYIVGNDHPCHNELCQYIENTLIVYQNFSAGSKIQIVSNLLLFMSRLIQIFSLEVSAHDKNYKKLRTVLQYIDEHFTEKIQISELSELIHVCDDRLIRLFKQVTGETPIEYIMNLRIESAIKMLSSTDAPVSDIAEACGFGSATYMTRVFKRRLKTTPGKYRH